MDLIYIPGGVPHEYQKFKGTICLFVWCYTEPFGVPRESRAFLLGFVFTLCVDDGMNSRDHHGRQCWR